MHFEAGLRHSGGKSQIWKGHQIGIEIYNGIRNQSGMDVVVDVGVTMGVGNTVMEATVDETRWDKLSSQIGQI